MFTASRYIVIDDEERHLKGIVQGLASLGLSSLAIQFTGAALDPMHFVGVRGLFLDLQLVDKAITQDFARHFAVLQTVLEDNISPQGGPFVLILWTDADERASDFEDYLVRNMPDELSYCLPAAVVPLSKNDHIDTSDGVVKDPGALRDTIRERLKGNPAFAAIMEWEVGVLSASGGVMSDLSAMSRGATLTERGTALAQVLRRLANASVGEANAIRDVRSAVYGALAPLLSDHLANLAHSAHDPFAAAFEAGAPPSGPMPRLDVARLNTRLHVATLGGEQLTPTDWGAVSRLGRGFSWDRCGLEGGDYFVAQVLGTRNGAYGCAGETKPPEVDLVQVRIGAACDYAQKSDGPVSFVLGALFPESTRDLKHPKNSPNWMSPSLIVDNRPVRLVVNPRIQYTHSRHVAGRLTARFRLREQLLMELIDHVGHHASRPGILRFP